MQNIHWGLLASSDTPLERKNQVWVFTSVWVPYRAPPQFILVSFTFCLLSPFPTNCSKDFHNFSRSLGVVKGCLFTYSLLFLNSDSCQASPTPHCSHTLFRSELPGIPQELLKGTPLSHAAVWPVLICFLSHTASRFPQILLCSETNRATGQKEERSSTNCYTK